MRTTAKIIIMAERMKDKDDATLEALFRSEPIEDDGFSDRVVSRVRRGILVRRWTLPVAVLVGGLIAAKPAAQVVLAMTELLTVIPEDIRTMNWDSLPQATTFILGGTIAGMIALFIKGLEE